MKPSERIQELANKFREENKRIDSWKIGIDAIVTYLDEQAELLETHTVKEECPCKKFKEKYPLGVFGGGGNDPLVIMSINCKVCDVEPPKEPSIELCEKCHMAYKGEHARFCIANDYKTGEEPATPEKKCCEDWVTGAIIDEMTRVNPARHLLKGHQGEKRNDIY